MYAHYNTIQQESLVGEKFGKFTLFKSVFGTKMLGKLANRSVKKGITCKR